MCGALISVGAACVNFVIMFHPTADNSIVAFVVLPYLLPDARCSPDHEKVYFTEV